VSNSQERDEDEVCVEVSEYDERIEKEQCMEMASVNDDGMSNSYEYVIKR
jgi:hypothetical protein